MTSFMYDVSLLQMHQAENDAWIWKSDSSGIFSVRNAFVCFWLLIFLAFPFSVFGLVRGEKKGSLAHGILVGNQREKTILGRGFLSFLFVHLVTILYCSDIVRSKDLSAHFF